jgi:hypothetical protein
MDITEHLIDRDIVRGDPSDPREVAEGLEDVPREEIPRERPKEGEQEESFTTHASSMADPCILCGVEGIE